PDTDNPTCAFTVVPERINTGVFYGYYSLIQFYAEFDACPINEGWISIQGTLADGDSCVFLWAISEDGDHHSYQDRSGDMTRYLYGDQTGIDEVELLPTQIDMLSNYPNPFNAKTTIEFSLRQSGDVAIDISDVLGRRIDKIEMGHLQNSQIHTVDYEAGQLATGVYFYNLIIDGEKRLTERFSLLK
ncbi:MAG: T9SS type A sorting domain-containing protein, partial [candidate division Zixibacteria bacterium]|nr:T9SS type A sorting domain-containing protein [candidate division Zixibacteria bacterium]